MGLRFVLRVAKCQSVPKFSALSSNDENEWAGIPSLASAVSEVGRRDVTRGSGAAAEAKEAGYSDGMQPQDIREGARRYERA